MTIMDRDEAKRLMEKVLGYSKAEECEVNINGSVTGNVRYALNTVTTSGVRPLSRRPFEPFSPKRIGLPCSR